MAKLLKVIIIFILVLPGAAFSTKQNSANDIIVPSNQEKYFNDDKVRPSLYTTYAKEIAEVEDYLNSFETFIAQFKQSNNLLILCCASWISPQSSVQFTCRRFIKTALSPHSTA